MKIEYNKEKYIEIAEFEVNRLLTAKNSSGKRRTLFLDRINNLTWEELQFLERQGVDRFSKMALLHDQLVLEITSGKSNFCGECHSQEETEEVTRYIRIFGSYGLSEHHEVNDVINRNDDWDLFPTIRALNDHGKHLGIKGIQPMYFRIVCDLLAISGGNGHKLDRSRRY